ncbi:MAG: SdrD B-like domain-containing protein, partial [Isosphaeraceae bacterium]
DMGNPVSINGSTGVGGTYTFTNLRPGTYTVTETQPAGYLDGKDGAGPSGGTVGNDVIGGVVIGAGVAATGYDFGELVPATIAGLVYGDANNNGTVDAGESGIAGVGLTLTGTDDLGQSVTLSATTAADGSYRFEGLRPGVYRIEETQPTGYLDGKATAGSAGGTAGTNVVASVSLTPGESAAGYLFGELRPASLAGSVYSDTNRDGVRGGSEPGLPGVTVTLSGTDDHGQTVQRTAVTGPGGSYRFDDLRPGTYSLTESQPPAWGDGLDATGSAGGAVGNDTVQSIVLDPGQSASRYTFGERGGVIRGTVFVENRPDGIREPGESGYPIARVTLLDANGQVLQEVLSQPDGTYEFTDLPAGNYTVVQTPPDGFTGTNPSSQPVTLPPGGESVDHDFGLASGGLAGSVFEDLNNNGRHDPGEPGIPGVTVVLTGVDSNVAGVSRTAITGTDGSYRFDGLAPGTYRLTETQPAGWLDGRDSAGNAGGTVGNDRIDGITLTPGVQATGYGFGEVKPGSIGGSVFLDSNRDRVRQPDEYGIAHIRVTLTGVDDLGQSVNVTATTNDEGNYRFDGLRPGTYIVTESQPNLFLNGSPNRVPGIVIGSGQTAVGLNFAEWARKGCKLANVPHPGGYSVDYLRWRRSLNPSRFDRNHPRVGPMLASGAAPAARVPRGPLVSYYVPTLGRPR